MIRASVEIKEYLLNRGAALVGVAALDTLSSSPESGMSRAISVAVALSPSVIGENRLGPTAHFYSHYKRIMNTELPALAESCCGWLMARGYRSVVLPTSGGADPDTLRTPLSHKMIATKGGLGWIGKNGLLVTKDYGSAVMLISVLTDAPLAPGAPIDSSQCGDCTVCVRSCPGGALKGQTWCLGTDRDQILDAQKARATARHRALHCLGVEETVCGICIAVCPWTRRYAALGSGGTIAVGAPTNGRASLGRGE